MRPRVWSTCLGRFVYLLSIGIYANLIVALSSRLTRGSSRLGGDRLSISPLTVQFVEKIANFLEIVFANGSRLNCPQHIDLLPHQLRECFNDLGDAFDHDSTQVLGGLRTRLVKTRACSPDVTAG